MEIRLRANASNAPAAAHAVMLAHAPSASVYWPSSQAAASAPRKCARASASTRVAAHMDTPGRHPAIAGGGCAGGGVGARDVCRCAAKGVGRDDR